MDGLELRALTGLAQLAVALALLLFVPAWTIDYWQAWLFLIVFVGACALITIYVWRNDRKLLERRMRAGPASEKEPVQKTIQILTSSLFIALFLLPAVDHRFDWSQVPAAIVLVGDALVALGFCIVFLVFKENSFSAATIEVAAGQTVVSTGPYAVVRHPMYAGALVMLFGTPLALGSWWALAIFVPIVGAIVWRLLEEERFLLANLDGYADYRRIVRFRLVPFLW